MTSITKTWAEIKALVDTRGLRLQYVESALDFELSVFDGPVEYRTKITKNPPSFTEFSGVSQSDQDVAVSTWQTAYNEFNNTYKAKSNLPILPVTTDNVPFVSTNIFPPWALLYFCGAGDGTGRGNGQEFRLARDEAGTSTCEWGFVDGVYCAGGAIGWDGASLGDWVSLEAYAPASPVTAAAGNGNCNIINPGTGVGTTFIIPAAGNGAYNVDLTQAVPVPALDDATQQGIGYWDCTDPWLGKGTTSPNYTGKGKFYLFSIPLTLARFVNRFQMLGTGSRDILIPAIKPKYFLPQWKWKLTLNNSGHAGLKCTWHLATARKMTT